MLMSKIWWNGDFAFDPHAGSEGFHPAVNESVNLFFSEENDTLFMDVSLTTSVTAEEKKKAWNTLQ